MEDFEELDEQKIENLDNEIIKEKNNFEKKLKKAKTLNIIFGVISSVCILTTVGVIIFVYLSFNTFNPFIKHFLKKNAQVSTISQITENNPIDLQKFSEKLTFIDDVIGEMFYYDKDNKKIEDAMFTGYLSGLGDKYAEYFPAKEYKEFSEQINEGVYYGIGCTVTYDRKDKSCIVQQVYEDSPAEKGGLKEGDIFISVDGENIQGKDTEYLVSKIKGEEGTKREIEVYRKSENKNVSLTCYCGKVDIKLINSKILDDNIGYIDIDQFTGKAASQFISTIDDLSSKNIKGLIIDLRGNGGGELMTVLSMLDYIIKDRDGRYTLNQKVEQFETGKTLLVYIKERDRIIDAAYGSDGKSLSIPMVVLTDVSTASAAELFTATLRDYKKADIVGTRTFGKGVVQNMIECDDGSAFKFTTSEYFPASGYSIDKKGILPDYSLDYSGNEVFYNDENNIIVDDETDMMQYVLDVDGSIIKEIPLSTSSIINISNNESTDHVENLKIYDENNKFIDEDWFVELDDKYDDKQMLQAIIIIKNKLS